MSDYINKQKNEMDLLVEKHIEWVGELVETITRDQIVVASTKEQLKAFFDQVRHQAFEEGHADAHTQHAQEDIRLSRRTQAVLIRSPYEKQSSEESAEDLLASITRKTEKSDKPDPDSFVTHRELDEVKSWIKRVSDRAFSGNVYYGDY